MDQAARIEETAVNRRLIAFFADIFFVAVTTVGLFFALLYGLFGAGFSYISNTQRINEINEKYEINLPGGLNYKEYERVLQNFYLTYFPNEITNTIKKTYPNESYSSINNIYNVFILNLPYEPTPEGNNYKSDLHQYQIGEDGQVQKDILGIERPEMGGKTYEGYLRDHFYNKYTSLPNMLKIYDNEYANLINTTVLQEQLSRTIAFVLSFVVFYVVIPLCNKHGSTLSEAYLGIGHVSTRNGFKAKKYQIILRGVAYCLLPGIGIWLLDRYAIICLIVLPIFVSLLLMLFKESRHDLGDIVSRTVSVELGSSLIFKSRGEAAVYEKKKEHQELTDPDFLKSLENVEAFSEHESRDEELKEQKNIEDNSEKK